MADKEKKPGEAKAKLRVFGLTVTVIGLILAAVGIALLIGAGDNVGNGVKYGLSIAGIAVAFIGAIIIIIGNRKEKGEEKAKPISCMYCGEENPPGSTYCRKCGKPLVKKCVNCGAVLDMNAQYCNTCGVRVRKDS